MEYTALQPTTAGDSQSSVKAHRRNRVGSLVKDGAGGEGPAFATFSDVFRPLAGLAWPVCLASFGSSLLPTVSLVFVGHITGPDDVLSAGGLGQMWVNVVGYSLILGLFSGMDSLGSQAFGSGNLARVGILYQRSLVVTAAVIVPIAVLWWFAEPLLVLCQQPPEVARLAARYTRRLIPGLAGYGVFESLRRFLQVQGVVLPMLTVMVAVNALHPLWNWLLIFKLGWGFDGAAWATVVSQTVAAVVMLVYMRVVSPHVPGTWNGFSWEAFHGLKEYMRYGVPGALMMALEWICFELIGFAAGALSALSLSTNNIASSLVQLVFNIPYGFAVAGSTLIGNLLGAGDATSAKMVALVSIGLATASSVTYASVIAAGRFVIPQAFSHDNDVILKAASLLPIVAAYLVLDSFQCVIQGVLRGSGKQSLGAAVAFVGFYCITLPTAFAFAFPLSWGLQGLWVGMIVGYTVISVVYVLAVWKLNWHAAADVAVALANPLEPLLLEMNRSKGYGATSPSSVCDVAPLCVQPLISSGAGAGVCVGDGGYEAAHTGGVLVPMSSPVDLEAGGDYDFSSEESFMYHDGPAASNANGYSLV